ncbi:adenylate kinase [Candidatus Nitrososphaera gargensis Ga9.2]|uniref:Adenylate kinase n=1 Tax=Nitrososphaera gargensis (strain Ga9.2) TaxID=1237085 RepID=K0IH82_NITGG|nr:adenylate kinase [Candidatus Nitrososphaera gargensis]AFU57152.1 adenylate kinase [Candidatus Nitrososphaera gargensis Ga9.2]
MAENNKRAVIVGIPGVGKTTVITRAAEMLNEKRKTTVVVFGTVMFEEAKKMGLKSRDEMRRMPVEEQRRLQEMAAQRIAEMRDSIVLIDTHLFINTAEGYYPGLPMRLLNIMKPTNMIMVAADANEIAERRRTDQTRQRDIASAENIQKELDISRVMVSSCSILTGAPFAIIMNNDGQVDEAAANIAKILLVGDEK